MKTNNLPDRFAVHIETVNQDSQLVIDWFNKFKTDPRSITLDIFENFPGWVLLKNSLKDFICTWNDKPNCQIFTVSQFLELIREDENRLENYIKKDFEAHPEYWKMLEIKCVPYQICPICSGSGIQDKYKFVIGDKCPTCEEKRVIPMHIIK